MYSTDGTYFVYSQVYEFVEHGMVHLYFVHYVSTYLLLQYRTIPEKTGYRENSTTKVLVRLKYVHATINIRQHNVAMSALLHCILALTAQCTFQCEAI